MRLLLIRHGETPWTKEKRYQGSTDISLTPKGIRQAKKIARELQNHPPVRLYTSTLRRAKETAREIESHLKLQAVIDPRLNEINFGEWEGLNFSRLSKKEPVQFRRWCKGKLRKPPGGESIDSLSRRVGKFLNEILKRHENETVAVVSHGGPIKMFLFHALKKEVDGFMPPATLWSFRVDPGSISLVEGDSSLLQIAWTNRTVHLLSSRKKEKAFLP